MAETISFKKSSVKSPAMTAAGSQTASVAGSTAPTSTPTTPVSPSLSSAVPPHHAVSGTSSSRRKALKDFYKLQERQQREVSQLARNQDESIDQHNVTSELEAKQHQAAVPARSEPEKPFEITLDKFDEQISGIDFIKLVKYENDIREVLNSNESEIKSIIYNNYYELIKINDVLLNMKEKSYALGGNNQSTAVDDTNKSNRSNKPDANMIDEGKENDNDQEAQIVIGSDDDEEDEEEDSNANSKANNATNTEEDDDQGVIKSLNMIKEQLGMLKKVDLNILPNSNSRAKENTDVVDTDKISKCINRLLLSNTIPKEYVEVLDKQASEIKGKSLAVQLAHIRNKQSV